MKVVESKRFDAGDGSALAGVVLVIVGCWMAWPPLGPIVGGALLIAWGIRRNENGTLNRTV